MTQNYENVGKLLKMLINFHCRIFLINDISIIVPILPKTIAQQVFCLKCWKLRIRPFCLVKTAVHVGDLCDIRHDEWISYWVTVGLGIVNFPMVRVNAKVTIIRTCSFLIEIKHQIKKVNFYLHIQLSCIMWTARHDDTLSARQIRQ